MTAFLTDCAAKMRVSAEERRVFPCYLFWAFPGVTIAEEQIDQTTRPRER